MADLGASTSPDSPEALDHFDRLPDPVLLIVLNRIGDVKALGRCSVVSRRFHALVPQVDSVVVRVDCVISDDLAGATDKPRGVFSHLARLVLSGLVKPLHALGHILGPQSSSSSSSSSSSQARHSSSSEVLHHSPAEVLKNFKEIRRLKIELPSGELGVEDGVLLKWNAAFSSTLDSCVILGASSISDKNPNPNSTPVSTTSDEGGSIPESFYNNGALKLRVVWTISSLIAASARHYLLQPIISDHETLESLVLTDADGQGMLTMDRDQLQDLRLRPVMPSGSSQRTLVPALNMRLWYAPHLDLPGGVVLTGATLVAIRPSAAEQQQQQQQPGEMVGGFDGYSWVSSAFDEPYKTAAGLLVRRRTYCLEMNSF
ncbi:F-box domain-containing protein [Dioscorea alata]|uniref:F-box domain-containing protein n=2 Tax=Dioscorea alata TaxID=55571 RepID=A0ACB7VHX9_DIOAL|nr:F-box domain-containing protein [Dioscorea alata]KAH7673843.1 F-box domain-containing protein [Dioscorea alata]